SQPMFLPWRGIFEQIKLADDFVLYDDVQLPLGRSFMSRVQIKTPQGQEWLSTPIARSGRSLQLIRDAEFAPTDWRERHLGKLNAVYRGAPLFARVWDEVVEPIYACQTSNLSEFCTHAMKLLAGRLGLAPTWHVSSSLGIGPEGVDSSGRLLQLCQAFGA